MPDEIGALEIQFASQALEIVDEILEVQLARPQCLPSVPT
jgi:hypothetical protein